MAASRVASAFLASPTREAETLLPALLGQLRALHWQHWSTHWQVAGDPFYGDHLLLERLYLGVVEEIDTLAEKMVAALGVDSVAPMPQIDITQAWLARWQEEPDPMRRTLAAETSFQDFVKGVYGKLKAAGEMSLGLDDFLMSIANDHETNLYLLRQRLEGVDRVAAELGTLLEGDIARWAKLDGGGAPDLSAEGYFFDKPRSREVREFAQSGAISNDPGVAKGAVESDNLADSPREVRRQVSKAPPTVSEIRDMPGADEFSTLNRYVVWTEQPTDPGVPRSHADLPKHPKMVARVAERWTASRPR